MFILNFFIQTIKYVVLIFNCVWYFNFYKNRWIHEGHFHVNRVNLFLPKNTEHGIHYSHIVHNSSRNGLNVELAMLLNHLEADQLPSIDFKKLAIRFCDELQLPSKYLPN